MNNRLQFRHHTPIFETREAALEYIKFQIKYNENIDKSKRFSLFAEPTILRYKNEEDEGLPSGATPNPHVMLVIGSQTNETGWDYNENKFCVIDIDKTEGEIAYIEEELEKAISALTLVTKDSNSLKLYVDRTESGTVLSGDVRVAENHIIDDIRRPNVILDTEDGIFTYVYMNYNKDNDKITFIVNGETKEWEINNNYLIGGYYDKTDESLHLTMKDNTEVKVNLEDLINEWDVEGDASKTPIVLTREKVGYGDNDSHSHVEPWQDVLKADVRIDNDRDFNILEKSNDGRYLYVDGKASNIAYYKDGQVTTVKDVLDDLTKIGPSSDNDNIIINKVDGFFASTTLEYKSNENKLIFKASNQEPTVIELNSVEVFDNIYYDLAREMLVITYKDNKGETKYVEVPIGELLRDWEWEVLNEGHNVTLIKTRIIAGNDKLSADLNISDNSDNILVDDHHALYVKGTADNIKYSGDSTVKDEIDELHTIDTALSGAITSEIARATNAEDILTNTIGDGFSTDTHETVTYKFNEEAQKLSDEITRSTDKDNELTTAIATEKSERESDVNALSGAITSETARAEGAENTLDGKIDAETARAEGVEGDLEDKIEELSANTEGRLKDIDSDKSINVNKTNPVEPFIKVNLSAEVEDGKPNLIKLNNDGLYVGVDLLYNSSSNILTFKTTNGSKDIQLLSEYDIESITYDPTTESLVIVYRNVEGESKTVIVPLGELIQEWRVSEDTKGAIKLHKERHDSGSTGPDILSASAIVSTHDDNILVNDNGALYVSNRDIVNNANAIAALEGRMTSAEGDINTLDQALESEISRAENAEQELARNIESEIANRIADVDAEETRATQKENAISGAVQTLSANLSQEVTRATDAEAALQTVINNEVTRATNVENTIATNLANEVTRSTNKDNELTTAIAQEVNDRTAAITAEKTRAMSAETSLQTAINNEATRATNAENTIAETVQTLSTNLSQEVTRATNAENAIASDLANEVTRSTNKDNELNAAIAQEANTREANDTAEKTRAMSAETALQTAINNEATRATNAENAIASDLANEVTRSTTKDNELSTAIAQEVDDRVAAVNSIDSKIDEEITRAKASENALSEAIESIGDDYYIDVDNTNTVSLNKAAQAKGSVIKANVNISASSNNIIKENGDGIFSTVDLAYDETTNKLTFTTTNGDKQIALVSNSIIDKIYYDVANESIVIEYTVNGQRMDDVVVPVRDLINEIDVQSTDTVELIKTEDEGSGADVITANAKISATHGDNILVNDGGLYVNGSQIATNKANIESLTTRMASAEGNISTVSGNLQTAISEFAAASGQLNTAIVNEVARATSQDETLQSAINEEVTRSTSRYNELNTSISQETNDRIAADTAENTRAISAETALQTAINGEIARATNAETMLNHLIDDVNGEVASLTTDVTSLSSRLTEEITRSTTADSNLQTAISNETTRATSAESNLQTAINSEVTRATNAENALQTAINNISGVVSGDVAELAIQVANEITRSTNEDNRLNSAITNETARAISAETALSGAIASATTSIFADDTDTLALDVSTSGTEVHLSGNVNIDNLRSNNENNAIVLGEDGGLFLDRTIDCGEY